MPSINSIDKSLTVGTSVVIVSEAKLSGQSARVRLIVANVSTGGQNISLSSDAEAAAGQGIYLAPGGSMGWEIQGNIPIIQSRVTAIADAAGGSLAIHEEVLQ